MMVRPTVQVVSDCLARGWEESVVACWKYGAEIATQYDKPGDPKSRDIGLCLTILDPFAEPRLHRAWPGGFEDLEIYRREVVDGVHDHWIAPEEGKWEYTYHERLEYFQVPGIENPIDQISQVVDALVAQPYSRQAQAITWKPWADFGIKDPPCLQSFWFRIFDDQLIMDCRIRSNDAFKAGLMNMYAFTDLQRIVAERISAKIGRKISVGHYTHTANSFHIYGSYFKDFFEGFWEDVENGRRTFDQRTFRTDDPFVAELMAEAVVNIDAKLAKEAKGGR
ncbi:MAG: thymidylate synthase [Candidatus Berkelbacteria bacterium]|nr:thymidylate synthase [Candidatus Berkelbacteria bacterium]